ncbi:MAG: protein kinase [Gammaproteobacteria bacterium]|nr:protein kinase [Gammaproteobacteria bacterium]MBP9728569.1 protein kinase [Gammaproteobacteria bacterium]
MKGYRFKLSDKEIEAVFRSAPNLFSSDIEENLDTFIANYVEKFKLPRLSSSDLTPISVEHLTPVEESSLDNLLSGSGVSGGVYLYRLEIPLELEELGYHENDQKVVEEKHLHPVAIMISVEVVVKKIFFQGLEPELSISHFLNEVEILDHFICRVKPDSKKLIDPYYAVDPNIVSCYGYCYDYTQGNPDDDESYKENRFWIVMEYAKKGCLSSEIIKSFTNFERINASLRICEALYTLHSNNIVHVDLKPFNILVDHDGLLKLTDFGCSIVAGETFFLYRKDDYDYLKKSSYTDKYMPAIVEISACRFQFVFKTTSLVSEKKEQSFLMAIDCPENLREIVSHFFSGEPRSCVISLDSPVMHFLKEQGYSHSYFERVLNDHNGTDLWMAPEFRESLYREDLSYLYIRPSITTDIYSLGVTLAELYTGEQPYHDKDYSGNDFILLRKIVSEGLRPTIDKMYSEHGLVEVKTLEAGNKVLKVKELIQACWDKDPTKRPEVTVLIDFFREWIYDILVESITRNKVESLKYFLGKTQDLSGIFRVKPFKDHPSRNPNKISLMQYVLWAGGPIPILKVLFAYIPKNEILLQAGALLQSDWVKENGISSKPIAEKWIEACKSFEKQKAKGENIDVLRKQWGQMGRYQRQLPTHLFLRYCELQEACREKHNDQNEDEKISLWYRRPRADLKSMTVYFDACYFGSNKFLCRKEIPTSEGNPYFEDFNVVLEKEIAEQLLDEQLLTERFLQEVFKKPMRTLSA